LAVGDFNRDLKLDLAVANSEDDTISILLGNGAGVPRGWIPIAAGDGARYVVPQTSTATRSRLPVSNVRQRPVRPRHQRPVLLGNGRAASQRRRDRPPPGSFHGSPSPPEPRCVRPRGRWSVRRTVSIFLGNGAEDSTRPQALRSPSGERTVDRRR
jgi:hypothetical protein